MSSESPRDLAARLLATALEALESLAESERVDLLVDGHLERLISAIAPRVPSGSNVYAYLLEHKAGLCLLAQLRLTINNAYSVRGKADGQDVFISPYPYQWYEDGVMFLQGREPFTGLVGLYEENRIKFAIAARAVSRGEALGPQDFLFVDAEELQRRPSSSLIRQPERYRAIVELEEMLASKVSEECRYQEYLVRYPWVLGAQYKSIESHEVLDDRNVPDFTGVRSWDGARDIIEIKSPFLTLFKADDGLAATFNDAWNQAERYLDICQRESDYLRRQKGLKFDNPRCFLLLGYGLSEGQLKSIRRKERMNPAVRVFTYHDILAVARNTAELFERLVGSRDRT